MNLSTSIYRCSAIFLLFTLLCSAAGAQSVIRGTVKNANQEPLPGASVVVQGSKKGTVTDNAGNYMLSVSPGAHTLIVSFVGLATQRFNVTVTGSETTQDVVLRDAVDLSMVTVIGSRNMSRTRTETAVPVDVIPVAQVINEIGQVDLNQILTFIAPSFQSSRQTVADGTDHVDPAQLRGLGTDQVLVLVNGKRRHQSALVNVNGTINRGQVSTDLSAIPATAIERIEILRDGAAAQYGSDAIAGVINVVLKKRTGVLEAATSYGQHMTKYPKNYALYTLTGNASGPDVSVNDGGTFQGSLGYGFKIAEGYLHITGEYITRQATNRTGTFSGQIYPSVNGANRDDSNMLAKGVNRNTFDMAVGNSAMKSSTGAFNFAYPVGANSELYAFGSYSKKNGEAAGLYRYPASVVSNARIYAPNVFAIYPNGFLPQIHTNIIDVASAVGVRTKLGRWNLDVSNTFGINTFDFGVENSVNYSQFAVAGNAQTKFDAGGLNFWQNTLNADVSKKYDYLQGINVAAGAEYRIDAFGIKSGEEASYKNFDVPSGASSGAQVFAGFINTIGDTKTRNSKAAYIDIETDVTKQLLLTAAARYEHYSDFGSTLNYKFSGRYKFSDLFSIRASVSSGFRAPSMQQKYYSKTNTLFVSQNGALVQQESGTFTNESKAAQILGIPKLKQETSRNYSVGLTAKPFRGFEVTADAYQIDIDNRIILTNNFTGGTDSLLRAELIAAGATTANFFTNAIDTRSKGLEAVFSYTSTFSAKQSLRTSLAMTFIDNEVKKNDSGKVIIHASDILLKSGQLGNYYNREDQSRMEVASPRNKITLAFNYKYGKFSSLLRFVRFGEVVYLDPSNPSAPTLVNNDFTGKIETTDQAFSAKTVTDISFSYQIIPALSATIGANNIFDVYPDIQSHSSNMSSGRFVYSRRVQQMGFNGAYYFARVKLSLDTKRK